MADFTPGPWRMSNWTGGNSRVYAPDNLGGQSGPVADVMHRRLPEERLANARLIAAAPEMYEACNTVIEWLGHRDFEQSENAHPAFVKALTACRAALAKARGETT